MIKYIIKNIYNYLQFFAICIYLKFQSDFTEIHYLLCFFICPLYN